MIGDETGQLGPGRQTDDVDGIPRRMVRTVGVRPCSRELKDLLYIYIYIYSVRYDATHYQMIMFIAGMITHVLFMHNIQSRGCL